MNTMTLKEVKKSNLVRISTYAAMIGKSSTWVHKLKDSGEIKVVKIDTVLFVVL